MQWTFPLVCLNEARIEPVRISWKFRDPEAPVLFEDVDGDVAHKMVSCNCIFHRSRCAEAFGK